jgi:uncharacterized repeat protein (TIGR03803 family)
MTKSTGLKMACAVVVLVIATATAADAQNLTTLFSFNGADGTKPYLGSLFQATNGKFYGTTEFGGANSEGTVFEITPSGSFAVVYSFGYPNLYPLSGLVQASDGNLYGTTSGDGSSDVGTVYRITPDGQLTTIYNFCASGWCPSGNTPVSALIQGRDGNLYGTTKFGGDVGCNPPLGCGTVFKISLRGILSTLHSFNGSDGQAPQGALIQATNGNFYGTTFDSVFEMTPSGIVTVLQLLGDAPESGLVQASNGSFYGTTAGGGEGYGTVFEITSSGAYSVLHTFDQNYGLNPWGALIQATDGNLYGTTTLGGRAHGTIFELTLDGEFSNLYNFCSLQNCADGDVPDGGLVQGTNGNFYGTTSIGGTSNDGTIFELNMGLGPFVALSPAAGVVNNTIGILGQGLTGTTSVAFNGAAASFTVVSDTYVTATVPLNATMGPVTVTTPKGNLSSNQSFQILATVSARQ